MQAEPAVADAVKHATPGTAAPGATPAPAPGPAPAPSPSPSPQGEPAEERLSFGRAVWIGVRDAFAPISSFLDVLGNHVLLAARALGWLPRRPVRAVNYLEAAEYVGFGSLPIVLLVGAFTGMVMTLQSVFAFRQFSLEHMAGGITGKALALELAPVLTALMLAGRAGAGIATEIGTMRISEQIDALESMAVNPTQFLVLPRLVAGAFMGPILTLLFLLIGMAGSYLVAVLGQGVDHGQFIANVKGLVTTTDVAQGLMKAVVFGFLVVLIGCYQGYNASGGGRGVGIGTTRAVVIASVTVLITDYFLTDLLLTIMPSGKGA
jgi:phospholipid/cholesterol/gamma-HCH transport system permease protein